MTFTHSRKCAQRKNKGATIERHYAYKSSKYSKEEERGRGSLTFKVGGGSGEELVKDVIVALLGCLEGDAGFLKQVALNVASCDVPR